ncbi:MAG: hypothetical protein M1817_005881 [Caeruleum heppii]|nr:MAG: hypothetical protein M1817_005881 [Caeruleum heppii]
MAADGELPLYFTKQAALGEIIVREIPKFDLEAYIHNYAGRTRLERLFLIGRSCPPLSHDALKAALAEAQRGKDIGRYQAIVELLRQTGSDDPGANEHQAWVEKVTKQVKAETDRLEYELKGYKNNLIKESIRMGNEDLGLHYQAIGDLPLAFKAFSRMRDFCTSPKHVYEMCMKLIVVSIEQGNWMAVQSNVLKVGNLQLKAEDLADAQPKLRAAIGLAQMASGNYREAAESFLRSDSSLANSFNQVVTANDVAVYGGLCALASMDRQELQKKVLEDNSFRNFLELEPQIRRAVTFFCNSKYSQCLEILEAYKPDYLLDIYLQKHVRELYRFVRSKSIVQYFVPFDTVTLDSMAAAFGTNESIIQGELVHMIQQGTLDARIDTQQKVGIDNPLFG